MVCLDNNKFAGSADESLYHLISFVRSIEHCIVYLKL
jgi:hypothetical protein